MVVLGLWIAYLLLAAATCPSFDTAKAPQAFRSDTALWHF
jgi:hypothetical protein